MESELDSTEMREVNKILSSKGIQYQF
jgi:hypothetical protein